MAPKLIEEEFRKSILLNLLPSCNCLCASLQNSR